MIAQVIDHLVSGIVNHPDDVHVEEKTLRHGAVYRVHVNPDDLGKVIGRNGRTATSIRTVVNALKRGTRIDFVDVDRR